jgi:hypothetical protein
LTKKAKTYTGGKKTLINGVEKTGYVHAGD